MEIAFEVMGCCFDDSICCSCKLTLGGRSKDVDLPFSMLRVRNPYRHLG